MANSDVTNSFSASRPSDLCRPVRLPHDDANGRKGSSIMTAGPRVQASRHDLMDGGGPSNVLVLLCAHVE